MAKARHKPSSETPGARSQRRRRARVVPSLLKEAKRLGLPIRGAKVEPDGTVDIQFGKPGSDDGAEGTEDLTKLI